MCRDDRYGQGLPERTEPVSAHASVSNSSVLLFEPGRWGKVRVLTDLLVQHLGQAQISETLRHFEGAQAASTGDGGQIIVEAAPVSTGPNARVMDAGDYRFFAGWRSDPFFFDTKGALNNLQFTGDDFFADKDVCSIVLEVPNAVLGRKRVGLWARTLRDAGGVWIQADRGALPAQWPDAHRRRR